MIDLMYFGYTYEDDSQFLEEEFIESIKNRFPNVELINAYDEIKGYRQEVNLPDEFLDDFNIWLISNGWLSCSLNLQILTMQEDNTEINRIIDLTREQYPEAFKKKGD